MLTKIETHRPPVKSEHVNQLSFAITIFQTDVTTHVWQTSLQTGLKRSGLQNRPIFSTLLLICMATLPQISVAGLKAILI